MTILQIFYEKLCGHLTVMHAGPFSFNRRRRAQNGTGAAAFGGVGREISKIIYNKKF